MPRRRARASSTARISSASSRPAEAPSRCGSTTVVCSTKTRVSALPTMIAGRKLAGRARVDVGETRIVLRPRNSSAWTTTAYRDPRCSRPRAPRGAGRRNSSPLTIVVSFPPELARPSPHGRIASRRDRPHQQQHSEPRRRLLRVLGVGPPPRVARCEPPRSHSCLRREQP